MAKATITDIESIKIESLLSQKIFTMQDVVNSFDGKFTENQIRYHVSKKYPNLKGNFKKEYSKGGSKIEHLLKQVYPPHLVESEVHIGERLRVDFLVSAPYNIAFEFDGSQHAKYSLHLHGSRSGFEASVERDNRKEFLLGRRGVTLVRISDLDIDLEKLKLLIDDAGYGTGEIDEKYLTKMERLKLKQKALYRARQERSQEYKLQIEMQDPYKKELINIKKDPLIDSRKEAYKEKQREFRKQQYQKAKEWQKKMKEKKD
ncbi:MAG: hypothetical protein PHY47_01255 [Lachnospiraceae bacterium]|nr:hypothetical protein [Lachnospiraceae bacterium]